jgi:hypothetical protein
MQPFTKISAELRRAFALGAIALCAALIGCGGKEAPAPDATAPAKSSSAPKPAALGAPSTASAATSALAARAPQFLSVFSTNDPRDPFHPKVRPKMAATAVNTAARTEAGPGDIIAALEAGFKGTFGPQTERLALIHGAVVEQNLETTLTLPIKGGMRRVKVKPVRILRDTVEMQVEGVPQLVTLRVRR